jgi:hypothetical protein
MTPALRSFCAAALLLCVTACGAQPAPSDPPTNGDPPSPPPAVAQFALETAPSYTALEREWEIDIEYQSTDLEGIFAFYDQDLQAQGWQRVSLERESGEIEADYRKDGLELALEVELEDGRKIEVEIDIEELTVSGARYDLSGLPGLTLNFVPDVRILAREWDIDIRYDSTDVEGIFAHYDGLLQGQGWRQTDIERDANEIEADYRRDGSEAGLEVEVEDGRFVDVELDIDQFIAADEGAGGSPALDLEVGTAPAYAALEREWDVEVEYLTADYERVFDFYDAALRAQGWQRVSVEREAGEIEADYRRDGFDLELEVELEDGNRTEVDIEIEEPVVSDATYSLYALPGFTFELVPDLDVVQLEWDIETDYATADFAGVFAHYDALIQGQGWERVALEESGDETRAEYRRGGAKLELEVELDDGEVEVDLEVALR